MDEHDLENMTSTIEVVLRAVVDSSIIPLQVEYLVKLRKELMRSGEFERDEVRDILVQASANLVSLNKK